MRWLLATPEYPPDTGGVARYLGVLAEGSERWLEVASPHGAIVVDWTWRLRPRWLPAIWRTLALLRSRDRTGLIVSHVLPFGYAALAAWASGFPYAVICHGLDVTGPLRSPWKRFWAGLALKKASVVVANSEATANIIASYGVPEARTRVVHPPLSWDPNRVRPEAETDFVSRHGFIGKRVLLLAGRVVARKGIDVAVQAFSAVAERHPDVALAIVGGGPERHALRDLAERLGVGDRVIFTGRVSEDEMTDAYRAAEIVLYPSVEIAGDFEGFGIGAADAGMFAKPVVASRTGGLPEAVHDGETGLLVPPGDADSLASAIGILLDDRELAVRLGMGGLALARTRSHESFRAAFKTALSDTI